MNGWDAVALATALGGHLLHVIVIGGALLLAAAVYGLATITAPPAAGRSESEPSAGANPRGRVLTATGPRRRSTRAASAQQVAFLGLCSAAATHLAVMPDHFQESWIYGSFFALVAPLQLGLAWAVLVRARRAELLAALSFSLTVVVLWALTRFVGVPIGPDDGATEGLGVLDVFASACELLTAAALLYLLRSEQLRIRRGLVSVWRWSLWAPLTRAMLAALAVAVPLLSVFASRS